MIQQVASCGQRIFGFHIHDIMAQLSRQKFDIFIMN